MVSYGLLAELEVDTKGPGELVDSGESLDVRIRVKAPGWTRANRLTLYVTGVNVREEEILPGTNAGVKWEATWRLRKAFPRRASRGDCASRGIAAPYWPTAKPYQPTVDSLYAVCAGVERTSIRGCGRQ
jgi:hypothetical protein